MPVQAARITASAGVLDSFARGSPDKNIAPSTELSMLHQWIDGLHDIDEAAQTLPRKTRVMSVMDCEGDVYLVLARKLHKVYKGTEQGAGRRVIVSCK